VHGGTHHHRGNATSFLLHRNLGMHHVHHAVVQAVIGPRKLAVDRDFEALRGFVVNYLVLFVGHPRVRTVVA
jgi:hypothetical protein